MGICSLVILGAVEASKSIVKDPLLEKKVAAAQLMQRAMEVIKEERLRQGIPIDLQNDPNETGVIGREYTDLTTTLGSLSSKRTCTNPNFAGLVVEMLDRAGVKAGDGVAISFSGSFPALNIAVLSAVHVFGAKPVIISSVGASTYGANNPRLTWLDMEQILKAKKILPYVSTAASLGGIIGTGGGLDGRGIEEGLEAIRRNGISYLDERGPQTLLRDIDIRLSIYQRELDGDKPAVFINTGGPLTSLGQVFQNRLYPTGLIKNLPPEKNPYKGIIGKMVEQNVPVIHFLNIKKIARRYGLPIDPVPLPPIPDGKVMRPQKYSFPLAFLGLTLLCFIIASMRTPKVMS